MTFIPRFRGCGKPYADDLPTARIIPFPRSPGIVVTVKHLALGPAKEPRPYWHLPWLEGQRGWAPIVCHPNGAEDATGFFRCEQTAWQEAAALAAKRGWRAERNSVVAERLVANGRRCR